MKHFLPVLLSLAFLLPARGQQTADAAQRAALLAARGDVAALRPLVRDSAATFPPYVRLYCTMALARADRQYERMMACIDTLTTSYERELGLRGRIALTTLRAEGLGHLGRYAAMAAYCRDEEAYYRRRRVKDYLLEPLRALRHKAEQLAADGPRARMLRLVERDDAFALAAGYAAVRDSLDGYARLRCQLALAEAFHRPEQLLAAAEQLVHAYADSLDAAALTRCLTAQGRTLMALGRWDELAQRATAARALSHAHTAPLDFYVRVGQALRGQPATTVTCAAAPTSLGITYEWPLLLTARLGAAAPQQFALETGQRHTLVTPADAQRAGLSVLSDTMRVGCSAGWVTVRPALADSLRLGPVCLRNVLVYVVADSSLAVLPYERSIGTDVLLHLGALNFYAEKLQRDTLPTAAPAAPWWPVAPQLRLARDGGLRLAAWHGGRRHLFSIDTGFPSSHLSLAAFGTGLADSAYLTLRWDGGERRVEAEWSEPRLPDADGLLGARFLQPDGQAVQLDLRAMTLRTLPRPDDRVATDGGNVDYDGFYFERNAEALMRSVSDTLLHAYVRYKLLGGRHAPAALLPLCQQLRAGYAPPEAYADAEARCLFALGRYDEGLQLTAAVPEGELWGQRGRRTAWAAAFGALKSCGEVVVEEHGSLAMLPMAADGTVTLESGGRSFRAAVDASHPVTWLSQKAARRLKAERLVTLPDGSAWGVLPALELGCFTVKQLPCRIAARGDKDAPVLADAERGVLLGADVLARFGWVGLYADGRFVLSNAARRPAGAPLRLEDGLLVQGETPTGYATLRLDWDFAQQQPAAAASRTVSLDGTPCAAQRGPERGSIAIGALLSATGGVVLDFRNMRLELPRTATP